MEDNRKISEEELEALFGKKLTPEEVEAKFANMEDEVLEGQASDEEVLASVLSAFDDDISTMITLEHIPAYITIISNEFTETPAPSLEDILKELEACETSINQLMYRIKQSKEIIAEMQAKK